MLGNKFKVLVFGDGGVGKSSLVNRYLTGVFTHGSLTIGVDFHVKRVEIDGKAITLQIWDFGGEHQFEYLLPSYVTGSNGAIFMFDITRYSSINNFNKWYKIFKKGLSKEEEIPLIMVGGKSDLDFKRAVSNNESLELARKNNIHIHTCIECSAKTGENVEEVFFQIARLMMLRDGLI